MFPLDPKFIKLNQGWKQSYDRENRKDTQELKLIFLNFI